MKLELFMNLVKDRLNHCTSLLAGEKNVEYTRNNDKLHNFKEAAKIMRVSPEHALLGMWSKHMISVVDIVYDLDKGKFPKPSILAEKITDNINYLLLLEALIEERMCAAKSDEEEIMPKLAPKAYKEHKQVYSAIDCETKEPPY